MTEVLLGITVFTGLIVVLVMAVLVARRHLVPTGVARIRLDGGRTITAAFGRRLLAALAEGGILMPAACGGRGTCGLCRLRITEGGGVPAAVETSLLAAHEIARGIRLACQVTLRGDLVLEMPADVLGAKQWTCRVRSSRNVATLIKEIELEMPQGEAIAFRAGAYVQVTCPAHQTDFTTLPIDDDYGDEWTRLGLRSLRVTSRRPQTRAYSIASPPASDDRIRLLVRMATPPPSAGEKIPPGVVSSYLFGLRPGDAVEVSGPYGDFHVTDGLREIVLVGGGVGMAPLRSIILDELQQRRTTRELSFWYGARNRRELFYADEFDRLAEEHPNFKWQVALSEPRSEDGWDGETGFIHEVLQRRFLERHERAEDCDYYLCGPPLMVKAVRRVLWEHGVKPDSVRFDDFGA